MNASVIRYGNLFRVPPLAVGRPAGAACVLAMHTSKPEHSLMQELLFDRSRIEISALEIRAKAWNLPLCFVESHTSAQADYKFRYVFAKLSCL